MSNCNNIIKFDGSLEQPSCGPVIAAGEKKETNQNQPVSHDNQEPNQSQSKQSAEPNSLGCLLTIVITIGVSFLASTIYGPGVSTSMSNGAGDIVDFAGKAGNIAGMTLGMATLVGPITYSVMRKLFPKKPASPNITKSAGNDGKLPGSLVAANAPTGGTVPVAIAPGPHPAAKKPKTRVILLLALIVFGMAVAIWMQTTAKGVDL